MEDNKLTESELEKERKSLTKENASLTARRENLIRWTRKLSELKKIFIRI